MTTLSAAENVTIGTRIAYGESGWGALQNGDLGTVVGLATYEYGFRILMDDPRGRSTSNLGGVEAHWTTRGDDFVVVTAEFAEGVTATVTGTDSYHNFDIGTQVVLLNRTGSNEWFCEGRSGGETISQYMNESDLSLGTAAPAETLESFRVSFLTGAIARGEHNGEVHAEQVRKALHRLAGLEYLEPSKTLEDFQQRIVTLAMEAKGEHNWCGEPEAYLTEIGLGHLLPVRKRVTMTVEVEVVVGTNTPDRETRNQARALVREALPDADLRGVRIV